MQCISLLHLCAFVTIARMDIEELNKAQIVLLTLLVSFITSIATGIVTVTLMDQAPPAVTQVINRVVERTVETVIPKEVQVAAVGQAPVREVTVVVKENDLITAAIETNAKSLIRISKKADSRSTTPGELIGIGFLVSEEGIVATDATLVTSKAEYIVTTQAGEHYRARMIATPEAEPAVFLAIDRPLGTETFPVVKMSGNAEPKLGQTAIALSGTDRVGVAIGIVTDLETDPETKGLTRIRTDIADARAAYGSPLFNMFGEVMGIHAAATQTPGQASFAPFFTIPVFASVTEVEDR